MRIAIIYLTSLALGGCGDTTIVSDSGQDAAQSADASPDGPTSFSLTGVVEKGPFALGTTLSVQALNGSLQQTGMSFNINVSDATGAFALATPITQRYVEIVASGFYYDELEDLLSPSQVTLRAIADLSQPGPVSVNLLTSIQIERLRALVAAGQTVTQAKLQSRNEILTALGLSQTQAPLSQLTVASSGGDNAIGLAAGAAILELAHLTAPAPEQVPATLAQLVSQLSNDLKDGQLHNASFSDGFTAALARLDPDQLIERLTAYYQSNGVSATPPHVGTLLPVPRAFTRRLSPPPGPHVHVSLSSVAVTSNGSIVVVGTTNGEFVSGSHVGSDDVLIRMYDANGMALLTKQFGSTMQDGASGVALDEQDNIYLTGTTWGDLAGATAIGEADAIAIKLDPAGNMLWAKQWGGAGAQNGGSPVYRAGKLYFGYRASGNVSIRGIDPATGAQTGSVATLSDVSVPPGSLAIDSNGNIFVAGYTDGCLQPGSSAPNCASSAAGSDAFIVSYESNGTQRWLHQFGNSASDRALRAHTDAADAVYVGGSSQDGLFGEPGAFLAKYDNAGTLQWTHVVGNTRTTVEGIATTASGVFAIGTTDTTIDGYPVLGGNDPYLMHLDAAGNVLHLHPFGTHQFEVAHALALGGGNLYVVGRETHPSGTMIGRAIFTAFTP